MATIFVFVYLFIGIALLAVLGENDKGLLWVFFWPFLMLFWLYIIVQTWTCTQKGHQPGPEGYCKRCGAVTEVDYRW